MLTKKHIKSRNTVKVTFELPQNQLPEGDAVEDIYLAGDFNEWDLTATPMRRAKNGAFRVTLELESGHSYEFRYLVNGNFWCNDPAADGYIAGPYGADNCIVTIPNGTGD